MASWLKRVLAHALDVSRRRDVGNLLGRDEQCDFLAVESCAKQHFCTARIGSIGERTHRVG
jgi:hypothetical protein